MGGKYSFSLNSDGQQQVGPPGVHQTQQVANGKPLFSSIQTAQMKQKPPQPSEITQQQLLSQQQAVKQQQMVVKELKEQLKETKLVAASASTSDPSPPSTIAKGSKKLSLKEKRKLRAEQVQHHQEQDLQQVCSQKDLMLTSVSN